MSDLLTPVSSSTAAVVHPEAAASAPYVPSTAIKVPKVGMVERMTRHWLPTAGWALRRTGNRGLTGITLIGAALIFLVSTYRPVVSEIQSLQDDLAQARAASIVDMSRGSAIPKDNPRRLLESLPVRTEVPKTLRTIIDQADAAGLSLDTGKYDVTATRTGAITRTNVAFPVSGSYPAVRSFIDRVLEAVPSASITELSIERKSIADGLVEANIRLTLYTRGAP